MRESPCNRATITVTEAPRGRWRPLLGDSDYKWIGTRSSTSPPALTAGRRSLTIVNTFVSSDGFNEFLYVIEQKINGSWSTADRVDIGPTTPPAKPRTTTASSGRAGAVPRRSPIRR
ncbi:hypothetical protein GCM10020219_098900 [Nonomuraea dietziae]